MNTEMESFNRAWEDRVRVERLPSALLGREVNYSLILPEGYATNAQRFPVLYLLHGTDDDHLSWVRNSRIVSLVKDLPLIVVLPDAQKARYINSVAYGRYQDFFLHEFVDDIDANLRTVARRESRAIAGLSMGGYGAWRLGLIGSDRFVACASLSGSLDWGELPFDTEPYRERAVHLYGGDGPGERRRYVSDALWPWVEKYIRPDGRWNGPDLWFAVGLGDWYVKNNRAMRDRLQEKGIPFIYSEGYGGHDWGFWDRTIGDALAFVMRHIG